MVDYDTPIKEYVIKAEILRLFENIHDIKTLEQVADYLKDLQNLNEAE